MNLNTQENIEDATLSDIMRSLGVDNPDDLAQEAVAKKPVEEIKMEEAPKEAKVAPKIKRHYANKVDRLKETLEGGFYNAMLLTKLDIALVGQARKDKEAETAKFIKTAGVKVQNRVTFLIEHAQGKTAKLNNVMQTALDVLKAEGKLTTGNEGNLVKALMASGKTQATSRAMAGNSIAAMRLLQMVVPSKEVQTFVANPESLFLERLSK